MWSITVKLNWNKTAGPFLIFPLGGFHAIGNTKHVISSSWREISFCHGRKTRSSFFFSSTLLFYFSLSLWWISTNYVLVPDPTCVFAMLRLLCFSPEQVLFCTQWLWTKLGWEKNKKHQAWDECLRKTCQSHLSTPLQTCLLRLWPTCDKLRWRYLPKHTSPRLPVRQRLLFFVFF